MSEALVVLAHGDRDAAARLEYQRLASLLAERLPDLQVQLAVLEFPADDLPSIDQAIARCAKAGAQRLVALPYFLFAAGHARDDLPGELSRTAAAWPSLMIAYQPPLGVDRRILDVLESRADQAAATFTEQAEGPTALLFMGAGTSDPDANADLHRAARLLWERRRYPLVEVGSVSLTEPRVAEAIRRCQALGARRVLVVPYFLNTAPSAAASPRGWNTAAASCPSYSSRSAPSWDSTPYAGFARRSAPVAAWRRRQLRISVCRPAPPAAGRGPAGWQRHRPSAARLNAVQATRLLRETVAGRALEPEGTLLLVSHR